MEEQYSIMNVKDLIDIAFGDPEANTVNFKIVQTLFYLIARQLRILERHVEISLPKGLKLRSSTIKVTEIKLQTGNKSTDSKTDVGKGKGKDSKTSRNTSDTGLSKKSAKSTTSSVKSKKFDTQSADPQLLEEYVIKREKELRVIHQRADSHEQPDEAPRPMASVDDVHIEKLLVVERIPGDRLSISASDQSPKISLVTQREFLELVNIVNKLRKQFEPIGGLEFPENAQLMQDLRKNASLTDAMAALQLSARLEATEKVLQRMMSIVTTVVGNTDLGPSMAILSVGKGKDGKKTKKDNEKAMQLETEPKDRVTGLELQLALTKVTEDLMKNFSETTTEAINTANNAYKKAAHIETRLASAENAGPRMVALENLIAKFAEQINVLDTGLTSQVTNYQEQLIQMQHELEVGLEAMNEALANAQCGDVIAVTELHTSLSHLQMDYEAMVYRQKNLHEHQKILANDISNLMKLIEMMRDTKADRDEVADALRDKAGLKDLNGIISLEQFDAIRGDMEKRISAAYEKFNNQEIVWQRAIDDLLRELYEKADIIQLTGLKEDIDKYMNKFKARTDWMLSIIGEPGTAATTKRIYRDAPCLCCSSPAVMPMDQPAVPPALPKAFTRKKTSHGKDGKHEEESKGDGDHKICYPGFPIPPPPHPREPDWQYCHRYTGGSHTLTSTGPSKVPPDTIITQLTKPGTKKPELDVKVRAPCVPCTQSIQKPMEVLLEPKQQPEPAETAPPRLEIIQETLAEAEIQKDELPDVKESPPDIADTDDETKVTNPVKLIVSILAHGGGEDMQTEPKNVEFSEFHEN